MEIVSRRVLLTVFLFLQNKVGRTSSTDCYSCVNITNPADCHHIQQCTTEQCYITKIEYMTGEVYYTLGCSNHNIRECSDYLLPEISITYAPNNHSIISVYPGTTSASSTTLPLPVSRPATHVTQPTASSTTNTSGSTKTASQTNVVTMLTQTTLASTTQISSPQSLPASPVTITQTTSSMETVMKTPVHSSQNPFQYNTTTGTIDKFSPSSTTTINSSIDKTSSVLSSSSKGPIVSVEPTSVTISNVTISPASTSQETKYSSKTTTFSVSTTTLPESTSTDESTLLSSTIPFTSTMKTISFQQDSTKHAIISTATSSKSSVSPASHVTIAPTVSSTDTVIKTSIRSSRNSSQYTTTSGTIDKSSPSSTTTIISATDKTSAMLSSSSKRTTVSAGPKSVTITNVTISPVSTSQEIKHSSETTNFSVSTTMLPNPTNESTLLSSTIPCTSTMMTNPYTQDSTKHATISATTSNKSSVFTQNPSTSAITSDTSPSNRVTTSLFSSSASLVIFPLSTSVYALSTLSTTKSRVQSSIMHSSSFYSNTPLGTSQTSSVNFNNTSPSTATHTITQAPLVSTSISSTTFDKLLSVSANTTPLSGVMNIASAYSRLFSTTSPPFNSTSPLKTSPVHRANYTDNQYSTVSDGRSLSSLVTTDSFGIKPSFTSQGTPASTITLTPRSINTTAHTGTYTSTSPLTLHENSAFSPRSTALSVLTASSKLLPSSQNTQVSLQRTANSTGGLKIYTPPLSTTSSTDKISSRLARTSNIKSFSPQPSGVQAYNRTSSSPLSTSIDQPLESQIVHASSLFSSTPTSTSEPQSKISSIFPVTPTLPINYSRSQMLSFSPSAFMIPTPPSTTSDFNNNSSSGLPMFDAQSVNISSSGFNSARARDITTSLDSHGDVLSGKSRHGRGTFPFRSERSLNSIKDEIYWKRDANAVLHIATLCCDELGCNKHLFDTCKDTNAGCALLKKDFDICSKPQEAQKICRKTCALCDYSDGNWSEWSKWTVCGVTCGNGTQHRSRSCTNPAPALGGRNCTGDSLESRDCQTTRCPADGNWTKWSHWSACSVSCGYGLRRRDRTCSNPKPDSGGMFCIGDSRDDEICKMSNPCSDAQWEEWSSWSACTGSCSLGIKYRQRNCSTIGTSCQGSSTESDLCLNEKENCQDIWMPWSTWSKCSSTCGYGTKLRLRNCTGQFCRGTSSDRQICYNTKCEDLDSAFFVNGPSSDGGKTGTIILQQVKTNVGGDYEVTTGRFICRIPGFYRFFVHIEKQPNVAEAYCHINLNHDQIVSVSALASFASIGYDIGASNTAVLHLDKGDVVRLDGCTNAQTFTNFTSFSGVLLIPD